MRYQDLRIKYDRSEKKRYYRHSIYPEIPFSEEDVYVTTREGDRLDILAEEFYLDSQLWWVISTANPDVVRRDSIFLKPGLSIRIPTNIQEIQDNFERLNK